MRDADLFGFGGFDEELRRMREKMDRMMAEGGQAEVHGPYVYGFSITRGPDGEVRMQRFGNVGGEERPMVADSCETGECRAPQRNREPVSDVIVCDDKVYVTVEVPGVERDDIDLEVKNGSLTVSVESGERQYYKEIELPCRVDPDTSQATYNHGVLDITFEKRTDEVKSKKIEVE